MRFGVEPRAWEKAKDQTEAAGVILNWVDYAGPKIAEEENLLLDPPVAEELVKEGVNQLGSWTQLLKN